MTWPLPRLWAVFLCLLVAATYRLWLPQSDVPAVAMFAWAKALPMLVGWLPLVGVMVGAFCIVVSPRRESVAWWLIAAALLLGFVLDQHRLQPWAYQSLIYASVFASMRPTVARLVLIPLAASIYIYSAAGKLDYQFVHSVGQDFINLPLGWFGLADSFSQNTKAYLAHLPPMVELVAGVLLLFHKTRRLAGGLAIGLHASLIVLLGPWGLHHSNGVLIWNVLLIVQAWFLFVSPGEEDPRDNRLLYRQLFRLPFRHEAKDRFGQRFGRGLACCLVIMALVMPATERAGLWDHWTSWALYSPHSSRTSVELHRSTFDKLPASAREHIEVDTDGDGWHELALDRWSLDELAVPVYPQARYQLALAYELATRAGIDDRAVRCRVRGVSNRVTGRRDEKPLLGLKEIRQCLQDYWLVPI